MTEQAFEQAREEIRAALLDMLEKLDDAAQQPPRLLTETQAAKYIGGASPRTMRDWRDKGVGPEYMKLEGNDKMIRYDLRDLDKWITEHPRRKERRA